MALIEAAKCANATDGATPSNAGVAGPGILLSFMITAAISIILSASVIVAEFRGKQSTIRKKLLSGYSDSQILQGIGIQSVGLSQMTTLVPYHFFLIWMLSLLSMATHNATLLALVHDYRRDWVLRWMRQFLMFVNLALSSISGIFILQAVSKGIEEKTMPIACAWQSAGGKASASAGLSYVGTIVIIAANCIIFAMATWYLHSRARRFYKIAQCIGLTLMTAAAVGAGARIFSLSQAFGNPKIELSDHGETQWSFGQVLSMLVLVFPLVSVVEIYRGELKVTQGTDDEGCRQYDGELQSRTDTHNGFQSNPFAGSQTNLVVKSDIDCRRGH